MTGGRRGFIKGFGGLTAASALCAISGKADGAEASCPSVASASHSHTPLPDWAQRAIDDAKRRIDDWRKIGSDVSLFVSITDVHSCKPDVTEPMDWADSKNHIFIAQEAARQLAADAMVDLGDADYQLVAWPGQKPPSDEVDELIRRRVSAQFRIYRDFERPVFFCRGNHDRGRTDKEISAAEFGKFNDLSAAHGHSAVLGGEHTYGYFDVPSKKVRLFFLDSSEFGYYGFSKEQVEFVAKGLETLPDDWIAAAAQHYCIAGEIGRWVKVDKPMERVSMPVDSRRVRNGDVLHRVFSAFVHSESGELGGISWNFAGKPQRRLAGCLCGDSHFDSLGVVNGVCYVVSQGYGGCNPKSLTPGAVITRYWSRRETPLIDVFGMKRVDGVGIARVFRIGAGGAARDREWYF